MSDEPESGCIFHDPNKRNRIQANLRHTPKGHVSAAEDQADVDRVLGGDPAGFEGLVRRWQRPLVNLAFRFCQDRGRAEEMAQEAFLRTYRLTGDLAERRRLLDLALCPRHERVLLRVTAYSAEAARARGRSGACHSPVRRRATMSIAIGIVRRAVLALPAKYREALMLFYFHDMDVSAAAKSLALPEGTIKARLSRGRAILLRKLSKRLAQPGSQQEQKR